jgi:hypothetical protein
MAARGRLVTLLATTALALACATAGPAQAVQGSAPDGHGHPYAGVIVAYLDGDPTPHQGCSGTLIAPTVFLTAGHCVAPWASQTGVTRYVTFDDHWSPADPPQGLDPVASFALPPGFGGRLPNGSLSEDVAVLGLALPVTGITPAQLPQAGLLDRLTGGGGTHDLRFDVVGYGGYVDRGGGAPMIVFPDTTRQVASNHFVALTSAQLKTDAVLTQSEGTNCYGDSGGPHLLSGTDVVVATSSWIQRQCNAWAYDVRLDSPDIQAFLAHYVTLP